MPLEILSPLTHNDLDFVSLLLKNEPQLFQTHRASDPSSAFYQLCSLERSELSYVRNTVWLNMEIYLASRVATNVGAIYIKCPPTSSNRNSSGFSLL